MYFGEAAAISTVPYIEDDLKEDRHYPSYRLGTYSVMTSRKWGSLRVTTRELNEGLLANDATLSETLAQELHNLCKLRHPQILLLMGICPRMLVFEHIQLGSLYFYLHEKRQVPSLKSYVDILLQIVDAVIFLHGRGFLHCSLGSHAVQLVSPAIAKLGQFEYAVLDHTKETQRHTFKLLANKGRQSLYNWLSPEVLNGEPPSKRGDIFSLCSVIWELSTSLVPWQEFSPEEIVEKVVAEKAVLPLDKSTMPSHLYQLMKQGLQYSSSKRDLDLEEIRDMLLFTRREIEEDRAKRTRAITFNGEVDHVLDNQVSQNGNGHHGHQNGHSNHNGHNQRGYGHSHHNGHHNHNGHGHQNGHAPSRPVPVRSLSSSAIQRGSMPGSARQYDRYTGLRNTDTRLKRKGFLEVGSSGGYREFEVYNDNRMTREYEVYRDGSDSSTERDYSFVTNTAKRNFLRSQPHRQKGLGRRSLTSLYHNGCDVLSVSDGLDLSSGGSSRDLSGLSGSSSSSISSGSGGLRRRQIGRSADSGIRVSADSGIRVSVELGSPVRKSSASSDDRNNLSGFKFPHTYRRKSRMVRDRILSGLDMQSSEMPIGRPHKSPDDLQPHRRSRSVPRVNHFSRPDYETAIKPASHRLERHASSHRLERHASSHSVHSGSSHRLQSSSTASTPKLSTTSQPKLSTVSQPKLSTASQPKLSTNSAPRLSETSQVKLSSRDPKGSNDQSLAFHSAREDPDSQEGSQPVPPPRGTIKQLQALLLQHGTRLTSSDKTRLQKPARTGAGGLLSSFFPHTSLLFRRSKDSDAKKDDPSVKASEAGLEQPTVNDDTSPFKTANDESSRYTAVSEASTRYRTAADQVTELLRRPVASNIHRRSKEIDGKKDDPSAMQSGQTSQMQSTDSGDFASCKQSMVVKKARYSERRQSRLDSSNLLSTNLSSVSPIERQTARIVTSVPQRAKLQSVEAVLHAQRAGLANQRPGAATGTQRPGLATSTQRPGLATSTPLNARTSETALNNQADRQAAFNAALSQAGPGDESSAMFETVMDSSSPPLGQPVNHVNRTSFSRESIDTVINSRGPTPTNPRATRGPTPSNPSATATGLTLPPNDEFGHHSIIQTVEQGGDQWHTPVACPPSRNVWDNSRKTVLRSSQPNTGPRKLTSVTFNSSVEAFTASSMGTSNTSSQEANNQASGQFESMNVEMRRGRAPARLSTISQRSSISSRTSLPETEDLYCDDELRPELEHDPHMQLYTANMLDTDDEDPLQDFPHHPIFDHNDRESVLSMEIPSTGPQSLRSECNTDTGSQDGSESRWAELSQGAWGAQEGAWHLAQDQASSKVKRSHMKELDESYLQLRDSFRESVEGDSDSTEYSVPVTSPNRRSSQLNSASFEEGVGNNVRDKVDEFESCIEESKSLSEQKGDRFRSFVQSLLDESTDKLKSLNLAVDIEDDCKSYGDQKENVKDSSSLNEDLSLGEKEATDAYENDVIGGAEFDDGWNIEKDQDSSWNDGGVDSGWNKDEQKDTECTPETFTDNVDSPWHGGDEFESIIDEVSNNGGNLTRSGNGGWDSHEIDSGWCDDMKEDQFKSIVDENSDWYEEKDQYQSIIEESQVVNEIGNEEIDNGTDLGCCDEVKEEPFHENTDNKFKGLNLDVDIEDDCKSYGDDKENVKDSSSLNEDLSSGEKEATDVYEHDIIGGAEFDGGWNIEKDQDSSWNDDGGEEGVANNVRANIDEFESCIEENIIGGAEFDGWNIEKDLDSSWNNGEVDTGWNKDEQNDIEDDCKSYGYGKENVKDSSHLNEDLSLGEEEATDVYENDIINGAEFDRWNIEKDQDSSWNDGGEEGVGNNIRAKVDEFESCIEENIIGGAEFDDGWNIDKDQDSSWNDGGVDSGWNEDEENDIEDDCKNYGYDKGNVNDNSCFNEDLSLGEKEATNVYENDIIGGGEFDDGWNIEKDRDSSFGNNIRAKVDEFESCIEENIIGGAEFDDGWNIEKDQDSSWNDGGVDSGWNEDEQNDIKDDCKSYGDDKENLNDSSSLNEDLSLGQKEATDVYGNDIIGGAEFDDGWNIEKDQDSSWNDDHENTDKFKSLNLDVNIEDDCKSCGDDKENVKDSSTLNEDLSLGDKEAYECDIICGDEFDDGWNIEKDQDSSWNDGGVDSGWNKDEQNDIEDDCKSYGDDKENVRDRSSLNEDLSLGEKEATDVHENDVIGVAEFDDGWNIEKDQDSSWNDSGVDSGWNKDEQNDTECTPETLTDNIDSPWPGGDEFELDTNDQFRSFSAENCKVDENVNNEMKDEINNVPTIPVKKVTMAVMMAVAVIILLLLRLV